MTIEEARQLKPGDILQWQDDPEDIGAVIKVYWSAILMDWAFGKVPTNLIFEDLHKVKKVA